MRKANKRLKKALVWMMMCAVLGMTMGSASTMTVSASQKGNQKKSSGIIKEKTKKNNKKNDEL